MNISKYMQQYSESIKGINREEKSELLEEISAHIAEGENDPALGADSTRRQERLAHEMGDPQELGRQMKRVHRSMAWVEYLLIVFPHLLLPGIVGILMLLLYPRNLAYTPAMDYFSSRLLIWIHIALCAAAYPIYRRHAQPTALLYLLPATLGTILRSYMLDRYSSEAAELQSIASQPAENIFRVVALAAILALIWYVLRKVADPLWTAIVSTSLLGIIGGLLLMYTIYFSGGTYEYPFETLRGWSVVLQISIILWPLIFLFTKRRAYRWCALLIQAIPFSIYNIAIAGTHTLLIFTRLLPVITVLVFFLAEEIVKRRNLRMVNQ